MEIIKVALFKEIDPPSSLKFHENKFIALLIAVTIIHFSIPLVATWDTAHYHNYLEILYGKRSWETWDVIRGPIFPVFIAVVHFLFGYSNVGMLLGTYLITIMVLFIAAYFIRELCRSINLLISYSLLFIFVFLNPIFLGYYHTILTEFLASFLMVFSVFVSYLWFYKNIYDKTKFKFVGLSLILIVLVPVSFHIKQPHVATTIMPLLGSSLLSVFFEKKTINILLRFFVVLISLVLLIGSLIVWHSFLPDTGIAAKKERTSYYMVSERLYRGLYSQKNPNTDRLGENQEAKKTANKNDVIVGGISLSELSYFQIENDKIINFIDRNRALRLKKNGEEESYGFLFVANSEGKIIDKILVGGKSSISRSIFELIRIFVAHPVLALQKYIRNFLQLTRYTDNPWLETEVIAFKSFEAKDFGNNVFWVADYFQPLIAPYKQTEINFIGAIPYKLFKKTSLWMFPVLLNVLSSLWLLYVLYFIFHAVKSKISTDISRIKITKIHVFLFISSFSIFSQIFFPHVLFGATNDRYAFPAYSLALIVFVIILLQLVALKKKA